jgi:predicted RNase H-like HicB family nuclease
MKTTFTVVLDRESDGRAIASVPGVPGCHSYGRTPGEAVRRVRSVLRFYLRTLVREGARLPRQPKPITVNIEVAV